MYLPVMNPSQLLFVSCWPLTLLGRPFPGAERSLPLAVDPDPSRSPLHREKNPKGKCGSIEDLTMENSGCGSCGMRTNSPENARTSGLPQTRGLLEHDP